MLDIWGTLLEISSGAQLPMPLLNSKGTDYIKQTTQLSWSPWREFSVEFVVIPLFNGIWEPMHDYLFPSTLLLENKGGWINPRAIKME